MTTGNSTQQIRLAINGLLAVDSESWRTVLEKAAEELEELPMAICAFLDRSAPDRAWTAEEFGQALELFKGAAFDTPRTACESEAQDKYGSRVVNELGPFMDWSKYYMTRYDGVLIASGDMWYDFRRMLQVQGSTVQ